MNIKLDESKLTPEMVDKLKAYNKSLALPKEYEPRRLFHATKPSNTSKIIENGIETNPIYGEIYLCDREKDCLKFVTKPCVIFEVVVNKMDMEELFLSRESKQNQAFVYYKDIPSHAIKIWRFHS